MKQVQTDNSHFADKVFLRMSTLPEKKTVVVLDAFAGTNRIWDTVREKMPGRNISVVAIEKEQGKGRLHLPGDNRKYLPSLDLTQFDIIDLDAYGIPFTQVDTVLRSDFSGILHVTFIQSAQGNIEKALLRAAGISDNMRRKILSIFTRHGWEYFKGYLGNMGLEAIRYIEYGRKRYIVLNCQNRHSKIKNRAGKELPNARLGTL